jgi:hypothetical protein
MIEICMTVRVNLIIIILRLDLTLCIEGNAACNNMNMIYMISAHLPLEQVGSYN